MTLLGGGPKRCFLAVLPVAIATFTVHLPGERLAILRGNAETGPMARRCRDAGELVRRRTRHSLSVRWESLSRPLLLGNDKAKGQRGRDCCRPG